MLSFNFTFNEFHPRETLPRNIDRAVLTASMPILAHNQKVLVKYLKSLVEEDDPVSHQLREISVQEQRFVHSILQQRHDFYRKVKVKGVRTVYAVKEDEKEPTLMPMWIHHVFLLQYIHPRIYAELTEQAVSYRERR